MIPSKFCIECRVSLPVTEFYTRTGCSGYNSYCKPCHKKRQVRHTESRNMRLRERRAEQRRMREEANRSRGYRPSTVGNAKKNAILGMSAGKARNILVKRVLLSLAEALGRDICFRCRQPIGDASLLSLDHVVDWLEVGPSAYFDVNNIAFSHLSCNCAAGNGNRVRGKLARERRFDTDGGRRCDSCRRYRDIDHFGRESRSPDGIARTCKHCKTLKNAQHRARLKKNATMRTDLTESERQEHRGVASS